MKSRTYVPAKKVNKVFQKRSYVKKDNRKISLFRGGQRIA